MNKKERLDVLLVSLGFFETREKAKRYIMTGNVLVADKPVDKPGTKISIDLPVRLKGNLPKYVGRGGLKLEKAIQVFRLNLKSKTMVDIGASTGGFTDCALQHGVSKVYAVDVGYGQLAWKLRRSSRVVNMERTNIKNITRKDIPDQIDFISIDVSFISLLKVLPKAIPLLHPEGDLVALIKPQFEAGKENVGKGGIVRDSAIHKEVLSKVLSAIRDSGMKICGLTVSPIRGADGNVEFLVWIRHKYLMHDVDVNLMIDNIIKDYQSEELL